MPEKVDHDLRATLAVAYRHFLDASTTEAERDQMLRTMAKHLPSTEGEEASRSLYHREQGRTHQLTLGALLDKPTR